MRVLVTGASGQLGYDVVKELKENDITCKGTDKYELDITDEYQVREVISSYNPDVVIHCAAYTAVDKAEEERELCYDINVTGTKHVAQVCKEINSKMVYISTDYVFNGEGINPFEVTDKPNPVNFYGQTKYHGELEVQKKLEKHFIIRISWVFGINGNNFVKTMINLAKDRDEISVVSDQIGSPTYTRDLSKLIVKIIKTEKYGTYHATNEGYCSWYDFACEIFKQAEIPIKVRPIKTEDYPTKAKRPKNSRISKEKLSNQGFESLENWREALKDYMNLLKERI